MKTLVMRKLLYILFLISTVGLAQDTSKAIFGKITDGVSPLKNVAIAVNSTAAIFTNENGEYSLKANIGDKINYTHQGFKTTTIQVEDVTRVLNIEMVIDVEELEEVTILGSNRKSQRILALEYPSNLNIIKTAFGYLNADTAPGNIRFLQEDEISSIAICILDLLRNRFSGIRVQGECIGAFGATLQNLTGNSNLVGIAESNSPGVVGLTSNAGTGVLSNLNQGKVFIRGTSSLSNPRAAIFDLDGQILNSAPLWLDINNITRLAILNNFAATTLYGTAGTGGVIVINTHTGVSESNKVYDQARLRNNFASKNIVSQEVMKKNWPNYLSKINASSSAEDAKNTYQELLDVYGNHPYFLLDMAEYFSSNRRDSDFAAKIISENFSVFEKNPVLLKALAYQHENLGAMQEANVLYKDVLQLRPTYVQSYRDLAQSYRDIREVSKAAGVYTRFDHLIQRELLRKDSLGFSTLMEREYNNFLFRHKNAIVKDKNLNDVYIAEEDFNGTRLVFEWNDSEAEFELQFVNPSNQYVMFKHSLADNASLIAAEKEFGFSATEYVIDNSLSGTWNVNVNYLGNKSLTPSYLKATIYYNYGSANQSKVTKLLKMRLKNVNQEWFKISNNGGVAFD